jgi:hypothetical protein
MHRPDTTRFLLYIEPKKDEKLEIPVEDEITYIVDLALWEAKSGISNYYEINETPWFEEDNSFRGYHRTDCVERSTSCDYLLKNGMITNSLCVFYLKFYRNSIPESEMKKVRALVDYYKKYRPLNELEEAKRIRSSRSLIDTFFGEIKVEPPPEE